MKETGLIGTDPKYPSVVDHSWLKVDPATYDNYPSDNNPVRVLPKLSDLWRTDEANATLVPNIEIRDLPGRTAEDEAKSSIPEVIREAKKAMMSGKIGSEVADHLRSRFNKTQIQAAAEGLKSLSSEMGLLGNVYVDVSAFKTLDEADKFMSNHRTKLARDLLFDPSTVSPSVVMNLASKYRRNATTEIEYSDETLDRYRSHLVAAGRIPESFEIKNKDDLKKAFLYERPEKDTRPMLPINKGKKASREQAEEELRALKAESIKKALEASEAIIVPKVRPIISFIQEKLSSGKDRSDLKEMLRSNFSSEDIEVAAPFISMAISKKGLNSNDLDSRVASGELSECMAEELKRIAKNHPVKVSEFNEAPRPSSHGTVSGFFYAMNGHNAHSNFSALRTAACKALQRGFKMERVYAKLAQKLSPEDAQEVLREAISDMNVQSAGAVANRAKKSNQKVIIEEAPKQTLPDPSTIKAQQEEIVRLFEGSGELEVNSSSDQGMDFSYPDIKFDTANSESLDAAF